MHCTLRRTWFFLGGSSWPHKLVSTSPQPPPRICDTPSLLHRVFTPSGFTPSSHHTPTTRLSHAYHTPVTRLSHAHHTPTTRPSHTAQSHMPCDSDWKGPTTFWSEEAQFLREYLERPQDCYVVHVTEAFRFTLPLSRDHMLTVANPNAKLKWAADGGIAHCTDLNAQALSLHSGSLAGDRLVPACCNVEEACRRWDLPLHELANLRTNVQPEPIAQLVLEGRWGDLVWRASWKSPFATPLAHLDLPALRRRNQCQPADPRSGAACGYAEVHALLRDLQRWERCCCCCCHCCNNSSSNNNKGGRRRFCKQLRWCTWRPRPIGCRDIVRLCHSLTGCSGPLRRQARPQTQRASPHISLHHNYAT